MHNTYFSFFIISRDERTDFIRSKYVDKKYVTSDPDLLSRRMELAIESDDLLLLVRTWAQGAKLGQPFPSKVDVRKSKTAKL
jgi:hypothetical protein